MTGRYKVAVIIPAAMLFAVCSILLLFHYGSELWVWLAIAGFASFGSGAVYGWFSAGAYLRKARMERVERGETGEHWWSYNMAIHDGMRAIVSLTVGIGFFTLAELFKG